MLQTIEQLITTYGDVFWLKEGFTTLVSLCVFLLLWWRVRYEYSVTVPLYLGTVIGIFCIFFADLGYLSDNDVLKLLAPTSLFLLTYKRKRDGDLMLLLFLVPYLVTSFEVWRSLPLGVLAIMSHSIILSCVVMVKQNNYLSILISSAIGILINLIGVSYPPGTNDIFMNPALITLSVRGIELQAKNPRYTNYLRLYWLTLLCFAFSGSWVFVCLKEIFTFLERFAE